MKTAVILVKRNVKLFFKDKGMFFTALITPVILLVLYATFLGNVYRDSFIAGLPDTVQLSDRLLDGLVGGQLVSSILSVSCITVAFSANFLMVQDKANGALKDFTISPVRAEILSLSYYTATLLSTLTICFSAAALSLAYVAIVGWYMSFADVLLVLFDVLLLSLFGTALSSIINYFLSTQGQISAVGSIISAGYGFICGAYMPISSFSDGLQDVLLFLPGTYGTSLFRNHALRGALSEMRNEGVPDEAIEQLRNMLDCNLYFFDNKVSEPVMYLVLGLTVTALVAIYVLMNVLRKVKKEF